MTIEPELIEWVEGRLERPLRAYERKMLDAMSEQGGAFDIHVQMVKVPAHEPYPVASLIPVTRGGKWIGPLPGAPRCVLCGRSVITPCGDPGCWRPPMTRDRYFTHNPVLDEPYDQVEP